MIPHAGGERGLRARAASRPASPSARDARWAYDRAVVDRTVFTRGLVVAAALAVSSGVLVATWGSWRAVREAGRTVEQAEGEALLRAVRSALRTSTGPPSESLLRTVLSAQSEAGLTFVAVVGADGTLETSAGTQSGPLPDPEELRRPGPPRWTRSASGWRIAAIEGPQPRRVDRAPHRGLGRPPRPEPRAAAPPRPGPRRDDPGSGRPRRGPGPASRPIAGPPERRFAEPGPARDPEPPRRPGLRPGDGAAAATILLEFQPRLAPGLEAAAVRALASGGIAALALALGTLALRQVQRQREAAWRRVADAERLADLGEMSAVLAHEIRNPLASLKGNAQLLAESLGEEMRERRKAERLVSEAVRLQGLTDDLLELAREGPIRRATVDPSELARAAAQARDGQGGRIEIDAGGAPPRWRMDAPRMTRVLDNLLANALQASPEGERVRLRIRGEPARLVFEVEDRGPGIPDEVRDRLFDPFVTSRAAGTGLGLAVARRIVEMHGGEIGASAVPEGGTLLRVELPAGSST